MLRVKEIFNLKDFDCNVLQVQINNFFWISCWSQSVLLRMVTLTFLTVTPTKVLRMRILTVVRWHSQRQDDKSGFSQQIRITISFKYLSNKCWWLQLASYQLKMSAEMLLMSFIEHFQDLEIIISFMIGSSVINQWST